MKIKIVSKFVAAGLVMLGVGETCSYAAPGVVGINYGPTTSLARRLTGLTIPRSATPSIGRISARLSRSLGTFELRDGKARPRVGSFHCAKLPALERLFGVYESSKYRAATEEQMTKAIELANKYPNIVEYVVGNECLEQDFADGAVS